MRKSIFNKRNDFLISRVILWNPIRSEPSVRWRERRGSYLFHETETINWTCFFKREGTRRRWPGKWQERWERHEWMSQIISWKRGEARVGEERGVSTWRAKTGLTWANVSAGVALWRLHVSRRRANWILTRRDSLSFAGRSRTKYRIARWSVPLFLSSFNPQPTY